MSRRRTPIAAAALLLATTGALTGAQPAAATANVYYVDSVDGDDARGGGSPDQAWRSLARANSAALAPGDQLLLARGSRFSDRLTVATSGTPDAPILISAYGAVGNTPVIQSTPTDGPCVTLDGSYVTLTYLDIHNCAGPGGVLIRGDSVVVSHNIVSNNTTGIDVYPSSEDARILDNDIVDNNRMIVNTPGGDDDHGAFGILLQGLRTEVAGNRISGSHAVSHDYGLDGGAVEIYGGQQNVVHHNISVDNVTFAELGNAATRDNTYAYNVVRSSLDIAAGLVTRGARDGFGPVTGTVFTHNTVYVTGAQSYGLACYGGCDATILHASDNVLVAGYRSGYTDGVYAGGNNIYHGSTFDGQPAATDAWADPLFRDAAAGDLRPTAGSPMVDTAVGAGYPTDLDGVTIPVDGNQDGVAVADRGAYEYH
ncbi:right-handed parallel beta-helix repeat-containing protein [Phytohabitans aurantiacus]|uniref:Hemolysin n=1 Tax=Phytohabitans aurantiacus TaxID=3016789 RepID=A0ABQ5R4Z1_9ACTN|nr:right-handed parallel beta-helix repeat-containing protein [Phytohabitans aurantiacus]GLI01770.1 hemolysin [Phytohabitans aurantiacus]